MASITKHGNKWSVRYRDNGKQVRKPFDTKLQAEQFRNSLEATKPVKVTYTSPTLMDCEGVFIAWSNRRDRSANTLDRDMQCITPFFNHFPSYKQVHTVTSTEVLHYLDRYNTKKSSTYNKAYFAIKAFFKATLEAGYIRHNPVDFPHKKQVSKTPRLLSDTDVHKLIAAFGEWDKPLAEFVAVTGCRISEATNLTWNNLAGNRVTFVDTKERKDKVVYIPQALAKKIVAAKTHPTIVFPNRAGKQRGGELCKLIERAATRAGLPHVHWHMLRHSAATRMVLSAPLPVVQTILGHRNISTTQRYIHIAGEQLQTVAKGIMTQFLVTKPKRTKRVTTRKVASKADRR